MKRLLIIASLLISTYSAHATVVAEDTAEHTISFTFGRPTADSYLCEIYLQGPDNSNLDTLTFPNGDSITGDENLGNNERFFTRETSPASSILHLGSASYGTVFSLRYCHDFKVPSENPGGLLETYYKIQTPGAWDYFNNSNAQFTTQYYCPPFGNTLRVWTSLASNTVSDYTLLESVPFGAGQAIDTATTANCYTQFNILEFATGPRPANETAGNITVGVKDVINFN